MRFVVLLTDKDAVEAWETGEAPDGSTKEDLLKLVFGDPEKIDEAALTEPGEWRCQNDIVMGLHGDGLPDAVRIVELGSLAVTMDECEAFNRELQNRFSTGMITKMIVDKEKAERAEYERLKRKFEHERMP